MSTAMVVAGKWEGGGGLRSPLLSRVQGAKMSVLNEKCDFMHRKNFKIRNRIKGNTKLRFLVHSLRGGHFNYPLRTPKNLATSQSTAGSIWGFIIKQLLRTTLLVRNREILHKLGSTPNRTSFKYL
jgi:hypothetical protein